MAKKKNKTPNKTNHKKNTNVTKAKAQPVKANIFKKALNSVGCFFKKCLNGIKNFFKKVGTAIKNVFLSVKNFALKSVVMWNFIKKHKKVFAPVFALLYTVAIVFTTLGVEHCIFPYWDTVSVQNEQQEEQVQQFKMEQGQVYRISPDAVLQYEGYEFTSTIKPKNVEKAGEYFGQSYVNENEDNIYLDVVFKYTNKSSEPVRGDQIISVVTTVEGNAYEDIFTAIESKDGTNIDFSSGVEIAPGDYALVHSVFDVPKSTQQKIDIKAEVVTRDKSYIITFEPKTDDEPKVQQPEQTKKQTLAK